MVPVLSPHSYRIALDTGAARTLLANDFRKFVARVNTIGVIFEEDEDFGHIEYCPTSGEVSVSAISALDLSHMTTTQQKELRALLLKHKDVFSDRPGHCNVACHKIERSEERRVGKE